MIGKVPAGAKGADIELLDTLRSRFAYAELLYRDGNYALALETLGSAQKITEGERILSLDKGSRTLWHLLLYSAEGRYQLRYRNEMWDSSKKNEKEQLAVKAWKQALEYAPEVDLRLGIKPIVDACAGLCFLDDRSDGGATQYYCLGEDHVERWFSELFDAHSELVTEEDYQRQEDLMMELKFYRALRSKRKDIEDGIVALSRVCGMLTLRQDEVSAEACWELGMLFAQKADRSHLPEQILSSCAKSNLWLGLALECCGLENVARADAARDRIKRNARMLSANYRNPLQVSLYVRGKVEECRERMQECPAGAFEALVSLRQNPTATQAEKILIEAAMAEVCLSLEEYVSSAGELWGRVRDSDLLTPERKQELEEKFRQVSEKQE